MQLNMFCDAAHATCLETRRFVIFGNGTPLPWYSRRQNSIEASKFGLDFLVSRIGSETKESIQYKLRMMGIPLTGPTIRFVIMKVL
jgi:hypothetical protein